MKLSIVATLFCSSIHLEEFWRKASHAAQQLASDNYEIVLVNDGSPDDSLEIAVGLTRRDPHVVVVDLSRNFGHHKAMMSGLIHAIGDLVFLIDSDLEEDPDWLMGYYDLMKKDNCDLVYGVQKKRRGGWFERVSGATFYRLFRMLTGLHTPDNMVTACLMTRRYVDALVRHQEREVDMGGLMYITGFERSFQLVDKRKSSDSTYTLRHKFSLLVNAVTSFSNAPLIGIFYFGLFISTLAGLYTIYVIFKWLLLAEPLGGWTSIIASIWILGGLVISFIGVIGIYLAKVFSETKQRPYTIVRKIYRRGGK